VKAGALARVTLAAVAAAVAADAGWAAFGSAATLTVTTKNASAFRTCVLTAYPTTSTTMFDSWVDQNAATTNKASATTLQVKSGSSSKNTRAFLRFDLTKCAPAVAGTATVKTATLRLNLASAPTASRTYNLNRVTTPCPESATTCWTETGLTWNNQPSVAASATSTLVLSAASTLNQYYAFDVTADVAGILAGTASNYGWRIADSVESSTTAYTITFKSKDATSNAAGAPQLVVVYSP
jgi:hypothetical protein